MKKACSVTINVKETKQKRQGYKFKVFLYDLVAVTAVCRKYFVTAQCLFDLNYIRGLTEIRMWKQDYGQIMFKHCPTRYVASNT